jgi:hypothetical protein
LRKHGISAGRAKDRDGVVVRTQDREDPSAQEVAAGQYGDDQRDGVEHHAAVDDDRGEAEVIAEAPQHRAESPEPRIPAPAAVALLVFYSYQRAARRAHHGAGFLTKHAPTSLSDLVIE